MSVNVSPRANDIPSIKSIKGLRRAATEELLQTVTTGNLSVHSASKRSPLSVNIRANRDQTNTSFQVLGDTKDHILLIDSFQADPHRMRAESLIKDFEITIRMVETENNKNVIIQNLNEQLNKLKGVIDSLSSQNKYKDMLIEELRSIASHTANNPKIIQSLQNDYSQLQQKYDIMKHQYESLVSANQNKETNKDAIIKETLKQLEEQYKVIEEMDKQIKELSQTKDSLGNKLIQAEKEKLEMGNTILNTIESDETNELKERFRNFSFGIQPVIDTLNKEKAQELRHMADELKRRSQKADFMETAKSQDSRTEESTSRKNTIKTRIFALDIVESLYSKVDKVDITEDQRNKLNFDLDRLKRTLKSSISEEQLSDDNRNQKLVDRVNEYHGLISNQNLLLKLNEEQNSKLVDLLSRANNKYLSRELTEEKTRKAIQDIVEDSEKRRVLYIEMFNKCKTIAEHP